MGEFTEGKRESSQQSDSYGSSSVCRTHDGVELLRDSSALLSCDLLPGMCLFQGREKRQWDKCQMASSVTP